MIRTGNNKHKTWYRYLATYKGVLLLVPFDMMGDDNDDSLEEDSLSWSKADRVENNNIVAVYIIMII